MTGGAQPADLLGCWRSPEFARQAEQWASDVLAARGRALRGPLVAHRIRFWSVVMTASSDQGRVWFKATNPGQQFEAPLLARLAELAPERVLDPLAVEPSRGWMLLPDGGSTLGSTRPVPAAVWEELVVQAARLQADCAAHRDDLLATGLPALLPEHGAEYAARLVDDLARLPPTHHQHLAPDRASMFVGRLTELEAELDELAASGVRATLQPNDLGAGNALLPREDHGPYRLFDFGDAFWSHPFAALQVPVRMAAGTWPRPVPQDDAVGTRLQRAYLAAWSMPWDRDSRRLVENADRLASLHRCESWRRLLAHVDTDRLDGPPPLLADWLADALRV